jgi:hypothetical protein
MITFKNAQCPLPFVVLQNVFNFFEMIVIFLIGVETLVCYQLALLQQLLESSLCTSALVSDVFPKLTLTLKINIISKSGGV